MDVLAAAAVCATACAAILVFKFGFEALLDRADGGFHRPSRMRSRSLWVVAGGFAALAAVLWLVVALRALLD
jgi:hypothetical protein